MVNRATVAIPEKLFFKIGEVCELSGVQAHVLRYWESEFPMLAPQKNRAGQRTYRKRDVEMALRIKELLYDDQYTIAGAKKKLSSELRGASKLKVVTPEMSAATIAPSSQSSPPALMQSAPQPVQSSLPSPYTAAAASSQPNANDVAPVVSTRMSDDQRVAVRQLAHQLRDLLSLLDAMDANANPRAK